jgi:quinol monooxygenase YgiN
MAEAPIVLNVHFEAAPGYEAELAEQLTALLEPTRKEPGCLAYKLHFDPQDPKKLMFYEIFANQAALDEHVASPHFKKFSDRRETGVDPVANVTVTKWAALEAPNS